MLPVWRIRYTLYSVDIWNHGVFIDRMLECIIIYMYIYTSKCTRLQILLYSIKNTLITYNEPCLTMALDDIFEVITIDVSFRFSN